MVKTGWTIRTGKTGDEIVFKEYEKAIIDFLCKYPMKPHGSATIHEEMFDQAIKASRASCITFLDFLVDEGLCTFETATGKGGERRLYSIAPFTWAGVRAHIITRVLEGLEEGLGHDLQHLIQRV